MLSKSFYLFIFLMVPTVHQVLCDADWILKYITIFVIECHEVCLCTEHPMANQKQMNLCKVRADVFYVAPSLTSLITLCSISRACKSERVLLHHSSNFTLPVPLWKYLSFLF